MSSTYCLEINYRCAKSIVLPSQRLINHNQNRFKKKIISSKNATNGVVQVKGFNSLRNQSNYIVNFINKQKKDFNLDWHNIAVLSRYKIQLIEVIRALEQAKIPCSNLPGIKIFSSDIGLIILSYLRVINSLDKCDNYDLNLIINYPNRYVTNDFCKQILKSNNAFNLINEHIKSSEENNEAFRTARLKKFLKDIYHLNNQMKEQGSFELIKSIITIFSLNEFNSDQNVIDIDEADDETYLEIILDASKDFPNITEFILHIEKKIEEEDADNISKNIELENDFNKKVHINTIHSTKGKEWDLVIIFDTSNKLISKIENNPTDIEEERRVFYVGLTRAKKILAVTAKESNPLIFLKEAFIGNEMNKNNYEKIKFELIQIDKSINKIKDESKNLITSISAFEKKIKNINNGNYSIKIKNRIKNNEQKVRIGLKQLEKDSQVGIQKNQLKKKSMI